MKPKVRYILCCLSIIIISIAAGTACSADKKRTIEGVINDIYQIVTDDEEVYYIADNEKGEQIMDHVGQRVQATGVVIYDEEMETRTITIENFSIIENEDDFDETEDEYDFDEIDSEDEEN